MSVVNEQRAWPSAGSRQAGLSAEPPCAPAATPVPGSRSQTGNPDLAAGTSGQAAARRAQMKSARSRNSADFGLAPTISLTTSPSLKTLIVGMFMMP